MKHRSPTSRRRGATIVLGLAIALVLGAGIWLLPRPTIAGFGSPRPSGSATPDVQFAFSVDKIRVRSVPEEWNGNRVENAAGGVREALTAFYVAGFVDPDAWAGGEFPGAFAGFDTAAANRARRDLDALTLGRFAEGFEWVQPDDARLVVTFLVDGRRRPVGAVAEVRFAATGHRRAGGTMPIENRANYVLRLREGVWSVFSYDATTSVGSAEPTTTATPSIDATEEPA